MNRETDLLAEAQARALAYVRSVNDRRVFPDEAAVEALRLLDAIGRAVRMASENDA